MTANAYSEERSRVTVDVWRCANPWSSRGSASGNWCLDVQETGTAQTDGKEKLGLNVGLKRSSHEN
jgi:hypothetical protein